MENKLRGYIPDYACDAMDILAKEGGTPYIVGGAVRDFIMGRNPKDYDIASNLLPDEVLSILEKNNIPTVDKLGNNFGVVVGIFDGNPVEIATFRADVYGNSDAHRPEKVLFTKTIEEDLSRRDFTCNAMALGLDGNIVDPFNGCWDIEAKRLRPVGNARDRYFEDALRMYRACRFVSQLGFMYVEKGICPSDVFVKKDFWVECNSKNLSSERVRNEMEKLLLGDYPAPGLRLFMTSGLISAMCEVRTDKKTEYLMPFNPLAHLYDLRQNPKFHRFNAWEHTVCAVENIPSYHIPYKISEGQIGSVRDIQHELMMKYAALFHDAGKGLPGIRVMNAEGQPSDFMHAVESAKIVEKSLTLGLGYSKGFANKTKWIVANHMDFINLLDADEKAIKRWVRKKSKDFRKKADLVAGLKDLKTMFLADLSASRNNQEDMLKISDKMDFAMRFANENMCIHSSDLAIGGERVRKILFNSGIEVKDGFRNLLDKVQEGKVKNEESALAASLSKFVLRRREQKIAEERGL